MHSQDLLRSVYDDSESLYGREQFRSIHFPENQSRFLPVARFEHKRATQASRNEEAGWEE